MNAPDIRIATVMDSAVISALMSEAFEEGDGGPAIGEVWDERSLARLLSLPGVFCLISMMHDEPAGYLLALQAADEAELLSFAIRETQRRGGRGGELLDAARRRMREAGPRRLCLEVGVKNESARAFYEAEGFRQTAVWHNYYRSADGRADDVLLMTCDL